MNISQGVKSQLGSTGKAAIKQILQEPFEMAKTASQQVTGTETLQQQSQQTQAQQFQPAKPQSSLDEQKKTRIIAAHKQELDELITRERKKRVQKMEEAKKVEEQKKVEKEQQEKIENQSFFEKMKEMTIGRLRRRLETRLPKAA